VATFGVDAARNGELPDAIDVGSLRWEAVLRGDSLFAALTRGGDFGRPALPLFPVVSGDVLLAATADQVFAWNSRTGKPAWPSGPRESAVIYPSIPEPSSFVIGRPAATPRFTLTVDAGRLYARMGAPVAGRPGAELRDPESRLVCLDLAHGEGKLMWKLDASELDGRSSLEGCPLVMGGRGYAVVRRAHPQLQTSVLCFDAQTGRRSWDRPLFASVARDGEDDAFSHELLTAGDDALFLSSASGAIAAVEADDGAPRWAVTYETEDDDGPRRRPRAAPPCLFAANVVYAAPSGLDAVLAIDSRTGAVLWLRTLPGGAEHLLGARKDVLIVSGRDLWGLDAASGRCLWHVGFNDPASFGYGRGMLAGDAVYWPTREEILVVDQQTGLLSRRIPLLSRFGRSGGNLILAGDSLVVAGPDRISAYDPDAGPRQPPRRGPAKNALPRLLSRRP
jgi:outer membrane protein assembly factor BamB